MCTDVVSSDHSNGDRDHQEVTIRFDLFPLLEDLPVTFGWTTDI